MELVGLPYPGCPEPTWTRPAYSTAYQPKPAEAHYDPAAADKVLKFISYIHHYKGEFGVTPTHPTGRPFIMLPWQEHELMRPVYGWKTLERAKDSDGFETEELIPCAATVENQLVVGGTCTCPRLHRTAYMECAKKQGKTQIGAGIAGYGAFGDGEPAAEVYTYAADKDQAKLAFDALAYGIGYKGNPFKKRGILSYTNLVKNKRTGSFVKVQSSEVRTKHGPNAQVVIFDELHAQANRELWDVVVHGVAARRQPLVIALTTAGWDRNSICWEIHEYVRQLAEGVIEDPQYFGVIYCAEEDEDWTDPGVWRKAAPSLGVTVSETYYESKCREARQMPTAQNAFRQLFLSQWTQQAVRAIPLEKWDACNVPVDLVKLQKEVAFGGLDLSATTDMTAFSLVFPDEQDIIDVALWYFMPEENLKLKMRRDKVPYQRWADLNYVELIPGPTIRHGPVKRAIMELRDLYDIREIGYDPWSAPELVASLEEERVKLFPVRQGYASLSAPTKELLRRIYLGTIRHGGNPVLRWNADNAAAITDSNENVRFDKSKAAGRIDGIVATVMAIDAMLRNPYKKKRSVYEREDRGVLTG